MPKNVKIVEVIPAASRLVTSLRYLGYNFVTAVADIIDNSIEARASEVHIDVEFEGKDSWVRISDNGRGMKPQKLIEGMRFGTERDYDHDALGKFGLGLKTASLSQCEQFIVASRWNPNRADISAFSWDISHLKRTNKWEIIRVPLSDLDIDIKDWLKRSPGTVVLWKKLHRILGCNCPDGEVARRRLTSMCRDLETHLAMVFHRFLSGELHGYELKLFLNGNIIKPWDPFARDEPKTIKLNQIRIPLSWDGFTGDIVLDPFILPSKDEFSTRDAWEKASGPKKWNSQQGFYIYRAGRMIQSGGWSRIRTMDEHTKLARISMSFSPLLDDAFKIDVVKMRVQIPSEIKDRLIQEVEIITRAARERYDNPPSAALKPTHPISNRVQSGDSSLIIKQPHSIPFQSTGGKTIPSECSDLTVNYVPPDTVKPTELKKLWTLDEILERVLAFANLEERSIIQNVFNRFRKTLNSKDNEVRS